MSDSQIALRGKDAKDKVVDDVLSRLDLHLPTDRQQLTEQRAAFTKRSKIGYVTNFCTGHLLCKMLARL
jgi:hypothetical protein